MDAVQDSLEKNAAPGADGITPITNETISEIRMGPISGGFVTHVVDRENHRIINITANQHVFADGFVIRSVVEENGVIYIATYGEGINRPSDYAVLNAVSWAGNYLLARPGFNQQDNNIRTSVLSQTSQGQQILQRERQLRDKSLNETRSGPKF